MRPTHVERERLPLPGPDGAPRALGAIGVTSSGARGAGGAGETVRRTFSAHGVADDPNAATDPREPLVPGPRPGARDATAAGISEAAGSASPHRLSSR